ncbi:MAG: hypothetical protein E7534_06045 [Ruminococcaceae bacterium]|nr:hypothetical protein [Oscillospiraceae bacterium]
MKYSLTNQRKAARIKATVLLLILEAVATVLFVFFGIVKTAPASQSNTTEVVGAVQSFDRVMKDWGKSRTHYYTIHLYNKAYRLGGSSVDALDHSAFSELLSNAPVVTVVADKWNRIAALSIEDTVFASFDSYNSDKTVARTFAIVLFCVFQTLAIPCYIFFVIIHRTAKGRRKKKTAVS